MTTISDLYRIKNGGSLSPDECQQINKLLSKITIDKIPKEQYTNVADYLVTALNIDSVEKDLVPDLDALLLQLQNIV